MKYLISIFSLILLNVFQVNAASFENGIEPRIDVISENSFFILSLKNEGITINYGDRVVMCPQLSRQLSCISYL